VSEDTFDTMAELKQAFPDLKSRRRLHPMVEKRLGSLLLRLYPDGQVKQEPGEMAGGRADLGFYFSDGRYVIFELFATKSQVAQDLRHLEQSNAQGRIAILTDGELDEDAIVDAYFGKRPRDPFPWILLSDVLVVSKEKTTLARLRDLIDRAFEEGEVEAGVPARVAARLKVLALGDVEADEFAQSRFTSGVTTCDSRYVILAAIPMRRIELQGNRVLATVRDMLELQHWYNTFGESHPPRYWPRTIFEVPMSRRSDQRALVWEERKPNRGEVLQRLTITDLADVIFVSALGMVTIGRQGVPVFSLGRMLAKTWQLSGLVAQLYHDLEHDSAVHLCIAMIGTAGSHLGDFAKGYLEPRQVDYWLDMHTRERDWSCHAPNLMFCETVDVLSMEPKVQPAFVQRLAESISIAYNHDMPRCFDKDGQLPKRFFR